MSAELVTAIAGGLVLVLGAIGLLLKQVLSQVDTLVKSTREIHDLTNGSATHARTELKALRDKVESLHRQLADSRHETEDAKAETGRGSDGGR